MRLMAAFAAVGLSVTLAGCTQYEVIERAVYLNGADPRPRIDAAAALNGSVGSLSPSDAVVVARGTTRQLLSPQPVTMRITQSVPVSRPASEGDVDDGTPRPRLVVLKFIRDEAGNWAQQRVHQLTDRTPDRLVAEFRLLMVNVGNASWTGDVELLDRLPQGMTALSQMSVSRVTDNRPARAALSMIPYIGLIALSINDFSALETLPITPQISSDGTISARMSQLSLPAGQGVVLDFSTEVRRPADR